MSDAQGLVLLAHGARDPAWSAPFEAAAAQVRAARPGVAVRLAYLDFMAPTLPEAGAELAAAGCRRIDVVPLFLGAGGHVRKDVPALLESLRREHPALQVRVHPSAGEHPVVVAALADVALAAVTAPPLVP